jgi:hypothetical protein
MDGDGHMENDRVDAPSSAWQPEGVATHAAELADYLEQVTADPKWHEVAERTLRTLAITPGQCVVEVGCGTGVFLCRARRADCPTCAGTGFVRD